MQKQGKSRKGLIVGIVATVMLLVALAVVMAACNQQPQTAPTTQPTVAVDSMDDVVLYWNLDRAEYDGKSEAGMSSRQMDPDGYFHIRFFSNGKIVELKCTDRRMVNTIDINDLVGVRADENGVITEVFSMDQLPVEKVAWKFYVQSVGGNVIKANSSDQFNGMEVLLKVEGDLKVYDMSGAFDPVGTETTAAINDRIMAVADLEGNLLGVYIFDRSNMIINFDAECQHCGKTVTWQEWKDAKKLPINIGHYKLVTDVQLSGQQSMASDAKICLDLNGHRVDGGNGTRIYSVHNLNGELAIMDTSEGQTGVLAGHGKTGDQGVVLFVRYGAVYLYGGTIDASDVVTTNNSGGTAVYVAAQRFFYMNGGEIIGGTAVHQYNAETKKYSAGMGATIYNRGKFVLNDGVIRDGYAKSVKTVSGGKVTYQRGIGGNYFGSSGSILEINGGVIQNGKAGTGGNIFLDGTAEMIMNNGTITGGRTTDPGRNAGNIYIGAKATVTINCGTISGGLTRNLGGNIYLLGSLTMNGGVINRGKCLDPNTGMIRGNMTSHNLYVGGGARFSLYGGKIYGSVAVAGTAADAQNKTYVHFGTHAWIDGGDYGKNLSILSAAQVPCITVGRLRGDASIGVTASGFFTAETSENNLAFFRSDVVGADVLYVDNRLAIGRMACLCGSEKHFGECDGTELLWGPWTSSTTLPNTEGNYYLVTDVTRTGSASFGTSTGEKFTVNIDLYGHTVDCKQRIGLSYTDINIVDHIGGGLILCGGVSGGKDHTGGLLMAGNATTGLYGGTIALRADHNTCSTGGVFGVAGTATLNVYGGTIDGSNAEGSITDAEGVTTATTIGNGGAIRLTGTMNMTGGTVIGGSVTGKGGTIYMEKTAVLNLSGGTVKNGKAVQGGNIYVDGTGILNISGATVTAGSTKVNASGASADSNGGNIYLNSGATLNLAAGSVENGFSVNGGGNIYAAGKLNMTGGKIVGGDSSNNIQRYSKNIMAVNADLTLSGGEIRGYVSLVSGSTKGAKLTVSGKPVLAGGEYNLRLVSTDTSKYPRPVVTVNGVLKDGAKIVINETGVVSGVTVKENVKAFDATDPLYDAILTSDSCIALGYIHCLCGKDTHESWCDGKDLLWEPWSGSSNLTSSGNYYLTGNVTNGSQRSIGQSGKTANINLDLFGKTYEGSSRAMLVYCGLNIVDSVGGGTLTGNGEQNNHSGTLLLSSGANVNLYQGTVTVEEDHKTISYGGVVGVGTGATMNVYPDATIDASNVVVTDRGGAIRVTGKLNIVGGTVIGGDAKTGGAIAVDKGGELAMTSGSITGGKASNGSGGNVMLYAGAKATVTGGTIADGEALNVGGNIYLSAPESDTVSGGVFTLGGTAEVKGGTTSNNTKHGGSINLASGTVMVLEGNAKVSGGTSANGGGNFYVNGTLTIRDNAVVTGGKAKGTNMSYGNNIYLSSGTLNLEGGAVEGYISAVNTSSTVSTFVNISGSPEVNKGTTNLRMTYTNGGYPVVSVVGPISGENKIGIRLEDKSDKRIDGVANTGLFVANANGATAQGEEFFFADAPTGGQVVLMEDGLNIHGEGYRVACACGGRLEGSAYHTCSKKTWKPWKTANKLPTNGYYYLSTDISNCTQYSLSGVTTDRELGIDLNGHNVSATSGLRIFRLYDGGTTDNTYTFKLTITDNGDGTGKMIPNATMTDQGAVIWITEKTQTVNLFGGTLDGSASTVASDSSGGVISVGRGTLNIYGGVVKGSTINGKSAGKQGLGAAVGITYNDNGGTVNMYGGSIVGGSADLGDALYIDKTNAKFNVYGGSITGSVYAAGSGLTVGGSAKLEEVELADGVKLTVADSFDAANASVGVRMATPGAFAENIATDISAAFKSVDTGCGLRYTADKALELYKLHQHCFCKNAEALPADHACDTLIVWTAVEKASTSVTTLADGGHYYLNWTGSSAQVIEVPNNTTAYLCLNGATIYATQAIKLNSNSVLHICDCSEGKTGTITVSGASTTAPIYMDSGVRTVNLYSGRILGSANGNKQVSVNLSGGTPTFNMYGGTIAGGYSTGNGGNVQVTGANAKFNMYGGTITGGSVADSKHGGNVFMSRGLFVMNGGIISNGNASSKGGNVMLLPQNSDTAQFIMNGGTIKDGSAANGANVCVNAIVGGTSTCTATFTMNGGTISGGTASQCGAAMYVYSSGDSVIINGGTVTSGTAATGSCVYVNGGSVTVGENAKVDEVYNP